MVEHVGPPFPGDLSVLRGVEAGGGELLDEVFARGGIHVSPEDGGKGGLAQVVLEAVALPAVIVAGVVDDKECLEVGIKELDGASGDGGASGEEEAVGGFGGGAEEVEGQVWGGKWDGFDVGEGVFRKDCLAVAEGEFAGVGWGVGKGGVVAGKFALEPGEIGRGVDLAELRGDSFEFLEEHDIGVEAVDFSNRRFEVERGVVWIFGVPNLAVLEVKRRDKEGIVHVRPHSFVELPMGWTGSPGASERLRRNWYRLTSARETWPSAASRVPLSGSSRTTRASAWGRLLVSKSLVVWKSGLSSGVGKVMVVLKLALEVVWCAGRVSPGEKFTAESFGMDGRFVSWGETQVRPRGESAWLAAGFSDEVLCESGWGVWRLGVF